MKGEPIESVNSGLSVLVASLRQNPFALDSVWVSVLTYDLTATEVLPLTSLDVLNMPHITTPDSGPTHLGLALERLHQMVTRDIRKSGGNLKADWAPFLFVMTDGRPSDTKLYREMVPKIKSLNFRSIIGCAAGPKADLSALTELCDQTISLGNMDIHGFSTMFEWVSKVVSNNNQSSLATNEVQLPPPPKEIQLSS